MQRPIIPSRAFTLIELLVVISIIALLISILLPALGAARATAMDARCMTGVRQIMLAMDMYANDSDDSYALTYNSDSDAGDTTPSMWQVKLLTYLGKPGTSDNNSPITTSDTSFVFRCPRERAPAAAVTDPNYWAKDGWTYALNAYMTTRPENGGKWFYKRTAAPVPSKYLVLGDMFDRRDQVMYAINQGSDDSSFPGFRHGGTTKRIVFENTARVPKQCVYGNVMAYEAVPAIRQTANMAFGDGHVEPRTEEDLKLIWDVNVPWRWDNNNW